MELVKLILANLTGIAAVVTLAVSLAKYVSKAVREKNWNALLKTVTEYMEIAESKFESGTEKKEWVLTMIKASADTINYDIDMNAVGQLIDSLCDMSKVVNAPAEIERAGV